MRHLVIVSDLKKAASMLEKMDSIAVDDDDFPVTAAVVHQKATTNTAR